MVLDYEAVDFNKNIGQADVVLNACLSTTSSSLFNALRLLTIFRTFTTQCTIHPFCTKWPNFHFRSEIWRHHRVPRPRFPLKLEYFGNSAKIRVILRIFHCACTKRPYFHFRSKLWRHRHRVPWPRFPIGRENFGVLRMADIGLLNICMDFQDLLA